MWGGLRISFGWALKGRAFPFAWSRKAKKKKKISERKGGDRAVLEKQDQGARWVVQRT